MKRSSRSRELRLLALAAAFCAGVLVDSLLRVYGPPKPVQSIGSTRSTGATDVAGATSATGAKSAGGATTVNAPVGTIGSRAATPVLRSPPLKLPVDGTDVESMKGGFSERRAGHAHEAVDLLAPRNTPVHAVEAGAIAKLFVSKAGGNTIYQFDPSGRRCYYYAHLERYADGLHEGDAVKQGQVIGYVGTSGNAPAGTPHLHFAVFELSADRQWWRGRAIDPYPLFKAISPT